MTRSELFPSLWCPAGGAQPDQHGLPSGGFVFSSSHARAQDRTPLDSAGAPGQRLAGLIATHIVTVLGFWFGGFGLTRLDWNTANGVVYLPDADPLAQFLFGGLMHYIDAVLFAVLFAVAVHPRLPWANSELGNGLKGIAFGTVMAVIALVILTPLIYGPAAGQQSSRSKFG